MILELLPLALGSAIYPTLLAMVVLILGRDEPRRILSAYLAGALLTSLAVGGVVFTLLSSGHVVGGHDHTFGPGVDIAVGFLALVLFWVLRTDRDGILRERHAARKAAKATRAPGGGKPPLTKRALSGESFSLMFLAGMALNLPGALYIVALKDMAASGVSTATAFELIVGYNLIMFQWAEIPLIGYSVAPQRTRSFIDGINAWLGAHARRIAMVLCGLASVALIARGLIDAGG